MTSPKHLLIVDDEPVILQILKAVFESEPYRISCASNGREARQIIESSECKIASPVSVRKMSRVFSLFVASYQDAQFSVQPQDFQTIHKGFFPMQF